MPRKKKPFIDRKNSSTYHLVHRSQRDVGVFLNEDGTNEALSQYVLLPSARNRRHAQTPIELEIDSSNDDANENGGPSASKTSAEDNNNNNDKDDMSILSGRLSAAGLVDYNYDRHFKSITGEGTFVGREDPSSSSQRRAVIIQDPAEQQRQRQQQRRAALLEETSTNEVSRGLESIALSPACMDEDLARTLFSESDWDEDVEEILDDFVVTASQDLPSREDDDDPAGVGGGFDYDAHIRQLMERAQSQARQDSLLPDDLISKHEWAQKTQRFFAQAKPLHQVDEEEEEEEVENDLDEFEEEEESLLLQVPLGVVPHLCPDEERALCDKFEQTLLEYDSDDDDDDDGGDRPLEGDQVVEAVINEFLLDKKDMEMSLPFGNTSRKKGSGSGFSVLVGTHMVPAKDLVEELITGNDDDPAEGDEEDDVLPALDPQLEQPPPPEDVLIDGKSYFSVSVRNPWDCESILSTYSNLDNNPVTIGARSKRSKKKQQRLAEQQEEEDQHGKNHVIALSKKTGLPLPYREDDDDEEDRTIMTTNQQQHHRRKGETAEEKRLRKQKVKEERMMARLQKKMTKEAFKGEFQKRTAGAMDDDVGGKTVYRYT